MNGNVEILKVENLEVRQTHSALVHTHELILSVCVVAAH